MILLLLICSVKLFSQLYAPYIEVPVSTQSDVLSMGWAGGLNNPQFSSTDIDGDGTADLLVFDRNGNKILPMIRDAGSGNSGYRYAPEYEHLFPELQNWALFRDLNCDGIEDIVTNSGTGIVVWIGSRTGSELSYTTDGQQIEYLNDGFVFTLGVTFIDVPAVADMDGDGDLDILTFNLGGGFVNLFTNRASENGDPCGPLDFELTDECWGNFWESGITKDVDLGVSCKGEAIESGAEKHGLHAGSTLTIFDENKDGLMDLILGDLAFNNLNRLINAGDLIKAVVLEQDTAFPAYDVPLELPLYPAAFYEDANADGNRDLIVAPNSENLNIGVHNVWYYENQGLSASEQFSLQTDSFLVGEMVDVGKGASPVFFDYNSDGLLDLVIGNFGYYEGSDGYISALSLYENTGTATDPAYDLVSKDYAGLRMFGFTELQPTFGDIDGDGDEDMIVGEEEGRLHLFKNFPIGDDANFILTAPFYDSLDAGKSASPQLIDVDRDGVLDLLVGERNGNLNYYHNFGTPTDPDFHPDSVNSFFGGITHPDTTIGYSKPRLIEWDGGGYSLFVGWITGDVYRYDGIDGNLDGNFNLADNNFGGLREGERTAIDIADINDDGKPELITGNFRGGVSLYKEGEFIGIDEPVKTASSLLVFPNPASFMLQIELPIEMTSLDSEPAMLSLINIDGQTLMEQIVRGVSFNINTSEFENGLYFLEWRKGSHRATAKLMIQH